MNVCRGSDPMGEDFTYLRRVTSNYTERLVSEIEPGEDVFVEDEWRRVMRVEHYALAYPDGRPISVPSNPWLVTKLELVDPYLNILRFRHEYLRCRVVTALGAGTPATKGEEGT